MNDGDDGSSQRNHKFSPLEISSENDNHRSATTRTTRSPLAASAFAPILNLIVETEEKRKRQQKKAKIGSGAAAVVGATPDHRYQTVIADDDDFLIDQHLDDAEDFMDEDDEAAGDGVVTVPISMCGSCCSCCPNQQGRRRRRQSDRYARDLDDVGMINPFCKRFYLIALVLISALFVAVILIPKQKRHRKRRFHFGGGGGSGTSGSSGMAYARTCRLPIFESSEEVESEDINIHSWQAFQKTMEKNQYWCTEEDKNRPPSSTNDGDEFQCPCTNRVQASPLRSGVDRRDNSSSSTLDKKTDFNVQQNIQSFMDHQDSTLDVIFLGDDLIAQWKGLHNGLSQPHLQQNVEVFNQFFTPSDEDQDQGKDEQETLFGLALGVTGDECPNLLYRIREQYNNRTATPLVEHVSQKDSALIWWIIIGYNDIQHECSYQGVLAGILEIVSALESLSPHATIVINSLLPTPSTETSLWKETVLPLNEALECYVAGHEYEGRRVDYFDVTELFWSWSQDHKTEEDEEAEVLFRNETLFEEAQEQSFPNALGYQVWGQAIVEKIHQIHGHHHARRQTRRQSIR